MLYKERVKISNEEFMRINRLLDPLNQNSVEPPKKHSQYGYLQECIFFVTFKDGSVMHFALCYSGENYYDDVVWTSFDKTKMTTLSCAYSLSDVTFHNRNDTYLVEIVRTGKGRLKRLLNNLKRKAKS